MASGHLMASQDLRGDIKGTVPGASWCRVGAQVAKGIIR